MQAPVDYATGIAESTRKFAQDKLPKPWKSFGLAGKNVGGVLVAGVFIGAAVYTMLKNASTKEEALALIDQYADQLTAAVPDAVPKLKAALANGDLMIGVAATGGVMLAASVTKAGLNCVTGFRRKQLPKKLGDQMKSSLDERAADPIGETVAVAKKDVSMTTYIGKAVVNTVEATSAVVGAGLSFAFANAVAKPAGILNDIAVHVTENAAGKGFLAQEIAAAQVSTLHTEAAIFTGKSMLPKALGGLLVAKTLHSVGAGAADVYFGRKNKKFPEKLETRLNSTMQRQEDIPGDAEGGILMGDQPQRRV
ncbi:MAG: hypothetical protein ABW032_04845 [Burkholderiaceae bacterium]